MTEWADELAARVSGPQVVNDSKTPSGTVHVGSLRGPVILDVICRALRAAGRETTFLYGIDDLDPMDAQALLTPDAIERSMGVPLANIPDQAVDGHASYARHHAQAFIETFAHLGIQPDRYYWMSDHYAAGDMDPYIRKALDQAATVREIYRRVAHVNHPDAWHPLSVICEQCGRIGTTIVTAWDGERVHYECRADLVTWARGCGHSGWVSPFGGRAKLPWNLEWAAQWSLFGVTIEPCGKDLSTAGGSRDRSDAIGREVFEREPPINVPYEFLNIGGRKMSTSKGLGAAAHEIVEVIPAEQLRLLFLRPRPNTAIDFQPDGTDAIPRLFDEFDRVAAATAGKAVKGELPPGYASIFRYSLLDPEADVLRLAALRRLPFARVAQLVQLPAADLELALRSGGGPVSRDERRELERRELSAKAWLDSYAPPSARSPISWTSLPSAAASLTEGQRIALANLAFAARARTPSTPDQWQELIQEVCLAIEQPTKATFTAIYVAFLGLDHGPRAGTLLAHLPLGFVLIRLEDAAGVRPSPSYSPPPSRAQIGIAPSEYTNAERLFLGSAIRNLMRLKDPVLAQIPHVEVEELEPIEAESPVGPIPTSKPMLVESRFTLPAMGPIRGELEALWGAIDQAADAGIASLMPQVFGHLGEISERAGTSINAEGRPLSLDLIIDVLEGMEISFDAEGNVQMPTMIMHPDMYRRFAELPPPTPDQESRLQALIARKREEFNARRPSRKLS